MFIGCCTYSVREYIGDGRIDVLSFAQQMAELGIKGLEYNDNYFESWEKDYLDEVVASAARVGGIMTQLTCGGNFCSDDPQARQANVDMIAGRLRAAAYMGFPTIRANLGGMEDESLNGTVGVERSVEGLRKLLPVMRETGVKLNIENHGGASLWGDWILKIVLLTDPEWVGTCPDFGNFPLDCRYRELGKVFPYARHVHAKSHEFDDEGEDVDKDYGRIIRMLRDIDYDGCLCIEFEGPGDQIEGVKKTKALIEKYL